jgi:hypothetical protein
MAVSSKDPLRPVAAVHINQKRTSGILIGQDQLLGQTNIDNQSPDESGTM